MSIPESNRNKAAIYARVSTKEQKLDLQLDSLTKLTESKGLEIHEIYEEKGFSGAKDSRPELDRMMDDARSGKFGYVLVWKYDRFARSTIHLLDVLTEFKELGIEFISKTEQMDTSTPVGKFLYTIIGGFAELERDIMRERIKEGMKAAKKRGQKFGRPATDVKIKDVLALREQGFSLRKIAIELGISASLVHKMISSAHKTPENQEG